MKNDFIDKLYDEEPSNELLKFVVLTDLHTDFEYTPGSKKEDCGFILCCRSNSGMADSPEQGAGKWGTYGCDTPPNVLSSALDFIKDIIQP